MNFADQPPWHILHIDDDEEDFILSREMLTQSKGRKIQVDWSPTYEDGKEKLTTNHYNAVLVDYDLGSHTGIELIREYSLSYPAPLILYTGRGSIEVDLEAMQAGATIYITKNEANSLLLERAIRYAIELKERRKAAEQVRYQASLLAQVQDAIVGADKTWRITYWNKIAETVFGWNETEAIGRTVPDLLQSRFPNSSREQAVKQLVETGQFEGEVIYRRKDGVDITAIARTAVLLSPDGEPSGFVSSMLDITERKRAQEALTRSNQKISEILSSITDDFYVLDRDWKFVYANKQFTERIGKEPEDFIGNCIWEMFPMHVGSILYENFLASMEKGEKRRFEVRGQYTDAVYSMTSFPSAEGITVLGSDITERVRAEEALRESKERQAEANVRLAEERDRLSALLVSIPDEVWFCDAAGNVMAANPAAVRGLELESIGEDFKAFPNWHALEILNADGRPRPVEDAPLLRALRGEEVKGQEEIVRLPRTGEQRYRQASGDTVRDADGHVQGAVIVVRDVTERKRTENILRESEQRFRTMADGTPVMIWVHNPSGQMEFVNKAWEEFFGTTLEAVQFGSWIALVHPDDIHDYVDVFSECVRQQVPFHAQCRVRVASGEWRWIVSHGQPRFSPTGEYLGMAGSSIDITEMVQAKEELEQSQALLQSIIDNATAAIYAKDLEGRFILSNRCHSKLLGLTLQEVIGKTDAEIANVAPREREYSSNDRLVMEGGQSIEVEEIAPGLDGQEHNYLSIKFPLRAPDGTIYGVCGISTDITERYKTQQELKHYAEELERSNQALRDFSAIASHDLQEPLRKVQTFGQLLENRFSSEMGPEGKDYIYRITSASSRMAEMLDGLLLYSRVTSQGSAFKEVNLQKIAQGVLSDLEVRIRETGGKVELVNLPVIHADPMQMRQLLQNLIGNALKYHRPGVPPCVKVSSQRAENDMLQIIIQDNGVGFKMADTKRLFQPFVRLHGHSEYQGTGMGLAICQKIVERHNGYFTVMSTPGEGSTFIVNLPKKL